MYSRSNWEDTIVALATPAGVGAIGVLRLSGVAAISICDTVFRGKKLTEQISHTIHFGRLVAQDGVVIDEVLVSLFRAPRSYTGEDVVEISCHGSPYILRKALEMFIAAGARLAQAGEFTLRAFLNGKMALSQAEAVADLIAAENETAHHTALQQLRGGFVLQIAALREQLVHFASLVELELDFAEEDVDFANRQELATLVQNGRQQIRVLLDSFRLGNVVKQGVVTVIAGRPNAGKSTLLNALLNENRAIVSPIAGTTRDTIEESLVIHGIQFRLIDTAGIREAADQIEAIGIEKTWEKVRQSAVLLYVFDAAAIEAVALRKDLDILQTQEGSNLVVLANKADLLPENRLSPAIEMALSGVDCIPISAHQSKDIDTLKEHVYQLVVGDKVLKDATMVTNARHYESLLRTETALEAVAIGLEQGISGELLALDIRQALFFLGEISGEISSDDLLANIFSKFCIGK